MICSSVCRFRVLGPISAQLNFQANGLVFGGKVTDQRPQLIIFMYWYVCLGRLFAYLRGLHSLDSGWSRPLHNSFRNWRMDGHQGDVHDLQVVDVCY